ncbi:MAG TPA: rod shape-determining protein MreD [Tepidisphaeraceae bacterium]|nr:rod shape-determining protein MreD [Tepidisphaeraceae bacterium]
MRLLPYILLGYVVVGLQVGLSGYVHLGGAAPNLVLIVGVFFALFATRDIALLACFVLGLMQDMLTQQTLGLYALSYGALALVLTSTASMLYRDHPLTHAAAAGAASIATWILLLIHAAIFGPAISVRTAVFSTILTALLAPVIMQILLRLRVFLGIRVPRRWS